MAPCFTNNQSSAPALAYALFFIFHMLAICRTGTGCFESIISFGDSIADTGNLLRLSEQNAVKPQGARLPYGETFFHRPTGRCSDGRLVVDFIDGNGYVKKSLVLLGEIGGNDYNHPLTLGMKLEVLQSLAPAVVELIGSTLEELIKLGAETILVPGNFPFGCFPVYLTQFKSDDETHYDPKTGCINWLNEFSRYHNGLLEKELNRIRELHPHISIIYADYYNAVLQLFNSPYEFGFGMGAFNACCGGGGVYNYNASAICSSPSATCCEDPSLYVSWDGVHLTEAAYRFLAKGLLEGPYTVPHLSTICSPSSRIPGFYQY